MTHEEYKQQLTAWAGLTEKRLAALCDEYLPQQSELGQAARYSLLGGGKRVRAVLTLAACQLAGADAPPSLPPCTAAPSATHSSGFRLCEGSFPVILLTSSTTAGTRVEPPTNSTIPSSAAEIPASESA